MTTKAIYMVFNTCNLHYSLVVELNGLRVHTSICESQAEQIKKHLGLREGHMGTYDVTCSGVKHSHEVYWDMPD